MSSLRISDPLKNAEPLKQAQASRVGVAVDSGADDAESFRSHPIAWRQQSSRKLFGPLQQRMEKLLDRMSEEPSLSPRSRRSLEQLREFHWAADVAALSAMFEECPSLVDAYLDLMVCTLHEFPLTGEPTDGRSGLRHIAGE